MPNVKIGDNVVINKSIVGTGASIRKNSTVGNGDEIAVVGAKEEIKSGSFIEVCTTV